MIQGSLILVHLAVPERNHMPDTTSLFNLAGLTEPATKLIESVASGIGTLYEPTRIRRKARADADAALILASAEGARSALAARAAERITFQELRRQENIDAVVEEAIKVLPSHVSAEPVDPDWMSRFFTACQDVSHAELRVLWGRLLTAEVSQPGAVSRRTLGILQDLSPTDAHAFSRLCRMAFTAARDVFIPLDSGSLGLMLQRSDEYGVNFNDLLELEAAGLISLSDTGFEPGEEVVGYHGATLRLPAAAPSTFPLAIIPFTACGIELFSLGDHEPHSSWFPLVEAKLIADGIVAGPASADAPAG
jgi:hypothetical protein